MSNQAISASLTRLQDYVESEDFKGYDPYDTLNSRFNFLQHGKWIPALAIQLQKRNPMNLRRILGIPKAYNPKAIGLFLHAYSLLYQMDPSPDLRRRLKSMFDWLRQNASPGYSGYCWGYNFDWVNPEKHLKAYTPTIVVTSFVGQGIFEYFRATGDERALELLEGICAFILKDLPRTEGGEDAICFSYSPVKRDCCYNASMLGAELLMKVHHLTGGKELAEVAGQAVNFVLDYQQEDGHWNYSLNPQSQAERQQIDFHQGYILTSLLEFINYGLEVNGRHHQALRRGAEYYKKRQFFADGRSLWRIPKEWPADIHHQAQGIITFARLSRLAPEYLDFAKTIADWTIDSLQDADEGFFYYRKYRHFRNKTSYMRWGQAWMLLALATLLKTLQDSR